MSKRQITAVAVGAKKAKHPACPTSALWVPVPCPCSQQPCLRARAHFMLRVTQAVAGTSVYIGLWGYTTGPAACLQKKMGLPGKTGDGLFLAHSLPHWCTQQTAAWRSGLLHRSWKHLQTSHQCKAGTTSPRPAPRRGVTAAQPWVPLPRWLWVRGTDHPQAAVTSARLAWGGEGTYTNY